MNERIKQLVEQAGGTKKYVLPVWQLFDDELELFAKLITKECINSLETLSRNPSIVNAAQHTIKNHFGVE